ncbi:MAG TPA: hypothetical protein PKG60_16205 [Spirochaetota bacterium]|nr:hypothetical protein [Spirochaetota bacterium]HPS87005.1 hypothetical protein [Spirochaetota bacterium]
MTIKPIDLQTNIGQMTEVGKHEHARLGTLAAQQQILDKEANEKSILKNTRLDESEKGEKTSIKDEHKQGEKQSSGYTGEQDQNKQENKNVEKMKDEKMGKIIDIFK